ncbi:hypothetical protein POPTR_009G022366v4 [Populus trichocarpa]|jgi:hypothetical protein|uniref:Uncharacterized protein n=1 Tax=Populus trichocarpa TaxID=3694 RepID=A0A3N7FHF0_POPTR|nr:hypothetical protein BDE02_09G016900 [Populus trichocarpa]RQO95456.1 hypothetical protein POPTR_009G022366v4 [Populus trichocarpa]
MVHFSAIFSCFVPSDSSRVSDDAVACSKEVSNKSEKPKSKSKSSGAPVVVSYFP